MENYITLENEFFEVIIPKDLEEYGHKVIEYATKKIREYLEFFKEESYGKKIKAAYLTTREDYIKRIQSLVPDAHIPEWSAGGFWGGEIQTLIDPSNPYCGFSTLAHEAFHLLFQKFVYEKNGWNRIVWLDESLAKNFDGVTEMFIKKGKFDSLVEQYYNNPNLPRMEDLSFEKNNVITEHYDGYALFKIVGRYLIETKSSEELLNYINNKEAIARDGKIILEESLKYFHTPKMNLK